MNSSGAPKKMDGYVRVSRRMGREGPAYISPKVQEEAIQRWADYRGIEIAKWHVDEDQSGGTQNRPGLRAAIERIERGETEGIACWRLNRFARNVGAAIEDVQKIQALGGHLAFVEEDIDPTGPFGSFLLTVLLAVATLERDNISASWRTAKERAVARGARIGPTPLGYTRGEDGVLQLGEDAPIMKEAYRIAGQRGLRPTMEFLRERYPDRVWTVSTLRRLLGSRTYLGEVVHGDMVNATAHPAIVTRSEWEAAQIPSSTEKRASASFPLSGIAVCAGCGHPMVGSRSNNVRVYRCKYQFVGTKTTKPCSSPAVITADRLEDYVRRALRRHWLSEGWDVAPQAPEDTTAAQQALEEAEAELFAFAEDTTMRKALGPRYKEVLEKRTQAVEEARDAFREQSKEVAQTSRVIPIELIDSSDPEDLRDLASAAFRLIEVKRGRGRVEDRVRLFPYGSDIPISPS